MDSRVQQPQPAAARPSSRPAAREERTERRERCDCDGRIAFCAEHASLIVELL
jgi:hypothetical protein